MTIEPGDTVRIPAAVGLSRPALAELPAAQAKTSTVLATRTVHYPGDFSGVGSLEVTFDGIHWGPASSAEVVA